MRFFDQKLSLALVCIILPFLFLPKINLISIDSGETAGLRIDDLVLFFFGSLLMWAHTLSHQKLFKIEGWVLLLTGFSIVSFISNRLLVAFEILPIDAKIFYAIRIFEYFLFFYIGALVSRHFNLSTIVRAFFLWNVLWMILQKLNFVGGMASAGYNADMSGRVQGIASFPSEMGLLLNLFFCYLIYDESSRPRLVNFSPNVRQLLTSLYPYWMFCLFGIFIIFTGNRISILALVICFLFRIKRDRSAGSLVLFAFLIPLMAGGIWWIITNTAGIYERSLDLFSYKNIELFDVVWEKIDISELPLVEGVTSEKYDLSWWIRIHKWLFAIKSYLYHPECYLQGLGPGYCGAALDGGLLRILTEYGLVGATLFWLFFGCLARLNLQTKWMVITFLINMIFFDAYLAYKTMSFLLLACGAVFVRQRVPAVA